MSDQAFVCAIRGAFSQLAGTPLSAVRVLGATSDVGISYPALTSQLEGTCSSARLLLERPSRRVQSLSPIRLEVSVDVSKTALTNSSSTAEQAVRAEIEAAFNQNLSSLDTLFSTAIQLSCSAQGIPPSSCPNPPSLVLSLTSSGSTTPPQQETGNVLVPAVVGAIVCTFFVSALLAVVWWKARSSSPTLPTPTDTPGLILRMVPSAPSADDPSLERESHTSKQIRTEFVRHGNRDGWTQNL